MTLTKNDIIKVLERIARRMIEKAEYLSELDGVSGDDVAERVKALLN